jgi:hypothetical protein
MSVWGHVNVVRVSEFLLGLPWAADEGLVISGRGEELLRGSDVRKTGFFFRQRGGY